MLFLFRDHHGPLVRAGLGVALALAGLALQGGRLLTAVGIVLFVWGACAELGGLRARRRRLARDGQAS